MLRELLAVKLRSNSFTDDKKLDGLAFSYSCCIVRNTFKLIVTLGIQGYIKFASGASAFDQHIVTEQ